jgi:hypothetical protein
MFSFSGSSPDIARLFQPAIIRGGGESHLTPVPTASFHQGVKLLSLLRSATRRNLLV